MTYDPATALAELCAFEIKCQHHLRQIVQHQDVETGRMFATKLGALKGVIEYSLRQMHRKCECGFKTLKEHLRVCPRCGRTL